MFNKGQCDNRFLVLTDQLLHLYLNFLKHSIIITNLISRNMNQHHTIVSLCNNIRFTQKMKIDHEMQMLYG